jgi:Zn-dependent protease
MLEGINWQYFAISMLVLVVSLTVHELAHAKAAEVAGDDTARRAGRISISPLDHLDPVGTLMMFLSTIAGFGIGWAKPVPVNPAKFRHPRWDSLKVSLWGPLSNLLLALVCGLALRFFGQHLAGIDRLILGYFVLINVGLALFNLLPIGPLDGSHILSSLLPWQLARKFDFFMARYGFITFLALIMSGQLFGFSILGHIIGSPAFFLFKIFTGVNF